MKIALRAVIGLLFLLYPLLVYFGLQQWSVRTLALVLLALFIVRMMIQKRSSNQSNLSTGVVMLVAVVVLVGALLTNHQQFFLYYPVAMNIALLGLFASSVFHPPTVIERLARLQEPDLPPEGVRYTRNVTVLWCGFFAVNGSIAWYTVHFCTLQQWTLYNGFIAYLAMGMLFAAEFLYRQLVVKR